MKVICIMDWEQNPLSEVKGGGVKHGDTYTVKSEQKGYSTYAKREVDTYSFYETPGFYEKAIFIPLSDKDELNHSINKKEFDTALSKLLTTKPKNKKHEQSNPNNH